MRRAPLLAIVASAAAPSSCSIGLTVRLTNSSAHAIAITQQNSGASVTTVIDAGKKSKLRGGYGTRALSDPALTSGKLQAVARLM